MGDAVADHPSSEEIADYLNGRLSPELTATLESHFAECRACRQQVVSARRLLDTYRKPRPLVWAIPAMAAAVLVLVVAPRMRWGTPENDAVRGRGDTNADVAPSLTIVAPPDGDSLAAGAVVFVWHSQPGQPLFRVTLTEGAREVWSATTTDTTAQLPVSVSLERLRTYRWYVDAVGADGRSLTSGVQRFVVKP